MRFSILLFWEAELLLFACGYDSLFTSSLMIQLVTGGNGVCFFNKSKTKLGPLWISDYHETGFGSLSSEWKGLGIGLGCRAQISVVYVCLYLSIFSLSICFLITSLGLHGFILTNGFYFG